MKRVIPLLLIFVFVNVMAQEGEETEVQQTIEAFFEAFHAKDSVLMSKKISDEIIIQSIGTNTDGKAVIRTEDFGKFFNGLVSIPDSISFQEKILSFNIQVDGKMANAWTPYEFWYNGVFSHCGVNSFQLFKDEGVWRIIYLIDTRRKEGCKN